MNDDEILLTRYALSLATIIILFVIGVSPEVILALIAGALFPVSHAEKIIKKEVE